MKRIYFLLLVFGVAFLKPIHAQDFGPVNGPPDIRQGAIAFVHANIQTSPNTLLSDATLIISQGKIVAVGKDISIPAGVRVVSLNGKYIYPSFIDLYSDYGLKAAKGNKASGNNQYQSNKTGAYAWNDALHPELNAATFFEYDTKKSNDYLSSGFGMVLSMQQDGILRGTGALVLTGKGKSNELVVKSEAATGLSFKKGSSQQEYPGSAMGAVALLRQTYYDARHYAQYKKTPGLNLGLEALNKQMNLPALFEAENKYATLRAAKIAKEFGIQYILKTQGDDYQRLAEIKQTGMPLVVPINFPAPYEVEDPYDAQNINLADLKHWEMAPLNPGMLATEKVPFSITYAGCQNADEFFKNLQKAVQYGLTKEAALQALTTQPASLLKLSPNTGLLQANAEANFFIADRPVFEKGVKVLHHYTNGKQHIVSDWNTVDPDGVYQLSNNTGGFNFLVAEAGKTQAQFIGADTLKINLQHKAGIYTFSVNEKKGSNQKIRAEVWISQTQNATIASVLGMQLFYANGKTEWVTATRTKPYFQDKKDKDSLPAIVTGPMLYPFSEYGAEKLPAAETILFKNATVWTNEKEGILTQTDVLIANGKIAAIGKNLPAGKARVVDATNKHLTNGIIDEHSHIAIYKGVNECTQYITAEVRIGDVINPEDINIYRQLAGGVIACQQLHGSCNPIGGQSSLIKLRWGKGAEEMKIEGADGFIKFALGENVKQSNWNNDGSRYPQTRMGVEQVYYDAFIRAREYEKRKQANKGETPVNLETEALLEILNKKRFISCHSYVQSEINMLMHVADSMGFRVNTFTHILEGYKVADKMKAHGVHASTFADWWAYKYEVIDAIPQNGSILAKMGVTTAINSDDGEMGRRLNQEAAKMVKYGNISEEDAWKMVTLNPAIMLHLDKITGSIKAGKDADLVLWSDNPLSIYAKAEMTLVDGAVYYSLEKDQELRKANAAERNRLIQKMLLAKEKGEKPVKKVSEPDVDYHCETVDTY